MNPLSVSEPRPFPPTLPPNEDVGPTRRHILIAEDSEATRQNLQKLLEGGLAVRVDTASDGRQALEALGQHRYSLLITDLNMPRFDGLQLIAEIRKQQLPVSVIVTTGHGSIDSAVQAMRLGAYDFLAKPVDADHLRLVVQRALDQCALQDEVAALREQLQSRFAFQNVLSKNPQMHAVFELINNVAQTTATVLIEGETGTGKEQVARAVHHAAPVRTGPLVAVNCAALPEHLLESELFGHEKGAFTSAVGQRKGRFEMADGGTIFLDEVGDIPPSMQAKLLRVLQERRFERVGGSQSIEVDVRVIAATNRSLQRRVQEGKFREDLYYRFNVVKIELPPLRDRPEDIPLLAMHFTQKFARPGQAPKRIAPESMAFLESHCWPGNIRELENAIERACVTSLEDVIRPENLPPDLLGVPTLKLPVRIDLSRPLADLLQEMRAAVERRYLRKALKRSRGQVGRCAKLCGMSRRSMTDKLALYQINRSEFVEG